VWDCVPRVCGGGAGCAGGGVPLETVLALSWFEEVSLGGVCIVKGMSLALCIVASYIVFCRCLNCRRCRCVVMCHVSGSGVVCRVSCVCTSITMYVCM